MREAHPTDGWRMASNDRVGVALRQPRSLAERTGVAKTCCDSLAITMPMVVDDVNDRVGHAYSGMPDRLYILDREGKVAYKGGRGPFGFNALEMEQALAMLLIDESARPAPAKATPAPARVPRLSNEDAWKRLPPLEKGVPQPLPAWARTLADSLPRTTAGMLELDFLHRSRSPLPSELRGKMRWIAAHANRSAFGMAQALEDLRRLGWEEGARHRLAQNLRGDSPAEQLALDFARKLTLAADTVTDEELASLVQLHGEKQVVAMVLLLAHANFQDRLTQALGLSTEEGTLPPLEVRFVRQTASELSKMSPPGEVPATQADKVNPPDWRDLDFNALQKEMERQRARPSRIRVPSWQEVLTGLPKEYPTNRPSRILWSLVCLGYQPELSAAWLRTMATFGSEARQDRVFEESLFWVITRSLRCFY